MRGWLIWLPMKLLIYALALVGVVALVLTAMIGTPMMIPPELKSVSAVRGTVDMSSLPVLEWVQARDGTALGFRHYRATGAITGRGAIVVHGSTGSSGTAIHALSRALAAHGMEVWAVDIRGHGASGTRGDIAYVGQLEDDLSDFVGALRGSGQGLPLTLIGHSAGGGFALRVAGSQIQDLFVRTVLLAPYLGYDAPTNRPNSGGWANADIPRIFGLTALRKIGIDCCDSLPTLAFAVPANSEANQAGVYTERLRRNFATRGYKTDLAAATKPMTLIAGADDEMMAASRYADAVHAVTPSVDIKLIDGVNHMGIVSDAKAVSAIAEDVATHGMAGS